jgi:purine-nucleoside phosphorylase
MDQLLAIENAVKTIRGHYSGQPTIGVVLGSGLGRFTQQMTIQSEIDYTSIPHFPVSTVKGHGGKLIFGSIEGKEIVVMSGRFHFYEGYTPQEVVFPIRVMHTLGVNTLLISNAAGGVHPDFKVGDLMVIHDHISLSIVNPLLGPNIDSLGTRFPDMSEPYSKKLIQHAFDADKELKYGLKKGVYFGVTGPTFETRSEYKMIKILGADAVGMSTVQEVIAAVHCGMQVFAVSVITDLGIREDENVITHEEVLEAANESEPKLTALFSKLISII